MYQLCIVTAIRQSKARQGENSYQLRWQGERDNIRFRVQIEE